MCNDPLMQTAAFKIQTYETSSRKLDVTPRNLAELLML